MTCGWLVGWFYCMSTYVGLFIAKVFFSSNSNNFLFNNNHLFAHSYMVSSILI